MTRALRATQAVPLVHPACRLLPLPGSLNSVFFFHRPYPPHPLHPPHAIPIRKVATRMRLTMGTLQSLATEKEEAARILLCPG